MARKANIYGESIRTTVFIPINVKRYLDIFSVKDGLEKNSVVSVSSILISLALEEIKRRGFDPARYPEIKIL